MSFLMIYRGSLYLTLSLAALVMSIDLASEDPLMLVFPAAVAGAGLLALVTVDRHPRLGLSQSLANPLGLVAVALGYLEYYTSSGSRLVPALGHLLVYLQLIKMFQAKRVEDDWYLLLLSLVEVVVGSFLGQSDLVGILLMAWVLSSLWVLILGHLYRESERAKEVLGLAGTKREAHEEPFPGLIDPAFLASTVRIGLITIMLGGVIFLAMPRRAGSQNTAGYSPAPVHLTGFSEEVRLGQLAEILENTSIVMTVDTYDAEGNRVQPEEEAHWRGITLDTYNDKRWTRPPVQFQRTLSSRDLISSEALGGRPFLRHRIKLEPTNSSILFAPRPILKATNVGEADDLSLIVMDGSLARPRVDPGYFEYDVWTSVDTLLPQPKELNAWRSPSYLKSLKTTQPAAESPRMRSLSARLNEIAAGVLSNAGNPVSDLERARALEAYLRDSKAFHYSLRMEPGDGTLDPVENFLVRTRSGNCEYFASALALLLRAAGIPSRVVNGFKGGDWNALSSTLVVRQKHAHSWVEALVGEDDRRPVWLELDPTPPSERTEVVNQIGGSMLPLRVFSDFVRYVWTFYIVGYNSDRQQRILYGPMQAIWAKAVNGYQIVYENLRSLMGWVFDFPSVSSFFSLRGFLVSVVTMLALAGSCLLVRRYWHWFLRHFRGQDDSDSGMMAGASFYRRVIHLLAEAGLQRTAAETPREFARRASLYLTDRDGGGEVAEVPPEVVDVYYDLRFGRVEPTPERLQTLDRGLDRLEARLRGKDRPS